MNSSFVLLVLISNTILFGMKRERLENSEVEKAVSVRKKVALHLRPNVTIEMVQKDLNKLYALSLPNLDIVNELKNVTLANNADVNALSVYKKLSILRKIDSKKREFINSIQSQRRVLLLALPASLAKSRITKEFDAIREHLYQIKVNAQEELRQAYTIDPLSQEWIEFCLEACARSEFDFQSLQHPWNNTTWSPDTPENFAKALIDGMIERGFDPTAFNVTILDNELLPIASAGCRGAQSKIIAIDNSVSLEDYEANPEKQIWHYKEVKPGYIGFNPNLINETDSFIKHTVGHELTHAINGDFHAGKVAIKVVSYCAKVNAQEVQQHPAFVKLKLAQEINADVASSLSNPEMAQYALEGHSLYPESYGLLALIKTNWDILERIAAKKQRNNQTIISL
jgi:hypothetical protein